MFRKLKLAATLFAIFSLVIWLSGADCFSGGGSGPDDPETVCYDLADMQQVFNINSNSANHGVVFFSNPNNPDYYWGFKTGVPGDDEDSGREDIPEVDDTTGTTDPGEVIDGVERILPDTLYVMFAQDETTLANEGYTSMGQADLCSSGDPGSEVYYINQELVIPSAPHGDDDYEVLKVILLDGNGKKKGKGTVVVDPPISIH